MDVIPEDGVVGRISCGAGGWENEDLHAVDRRLKEMVDDFARRTRYAIIRVHLRMHPDTWEALDRWVNSEGMDGIGVRCNPDHERASITLIARTVANDLPCPPRSEG